MKPKPNGRKGHLLHELQRREFGVRSPWWSSIWALRHLAQSSQRRWKLVYKGKENSLIEFNDDLMWVTDPCKPKGRNTSVMKRICADGNLMTLFKSNLFPRPKEVLVYDIPDPVYRSSYPQKEYRPSLFALRKGNVLTRQDLHTGEFYDRIDLGDIKGNTMIPSFMQDILVIKSAKLSLENSSSRDCFFHFKVFQLHPFAHIASFNIDGAVFPASEHKDIYGKLRSAEIHDGMLLVMTDKDFTLVYNAQKVIEDKKATSKNIFNCLRNSENSEVLVEETPPLLFVARTHLDIVGMGACPWTYIRAVSNDLLEVRDLETDKLLIHGQVTWKGKSDQEFSPDYLMFFPDDSNRLVHVKTNKLRVLEIKENDSSGNQELPRKLVEVFVYPEKESNSSDANDGLYSRSGRLIKSKFVFDNSLNEAIAFDVEVELMILVIVEARRDTSRNVSYISKATFYDSINYKRLYELVINEDIQGDIETNHLSLHFARDVLNIVANDGTSSRIFCFRLCEIFEEGHKSLLRKRKARRSNSSNRAALRRSNSSNRAALRRSNSSNRVALSDSENNSDNEATYMASLVEVQEQIVRRIRESSRVRTTPEYHDSSADSPSSDWTP